MFGLSMEHLLIMGVILLVLGPRNLPALGQSMGKFVRNFKEGISGMGTSISAPNDPPRVVVHPSDKQNSKDSA